jgi:outer membrane protein assembly factor BamB
LVWTTPEISGVAFDPAYDNGRLFVMSYNSGDLLAYDAATGKQQWSEHIEFVGADPPTAAGGQVFLVAGPYTGTVYAVDETTGNINWTQQVDGAALSGDNPAYDGGSLYVSYACNYYKLDAATGMIDWNTTGVDSCEGNTGLPPVYYAGRVFMAESSGADYLLNANTGKIYGSYAVGWGTSPAFFTRNGEYYGLSVVQGILYCFRVSTGDVVWSFTHKGGVITSPIVVNNFVAVSVDYPTSRIYILNSATGKSLWSAPGAAQILVAGDDTLIAESDGVITAYAPRNAGRDALPKLR